MSFGAKIGVLFCLACCSLWARGPQILTVAEAEQSADVGNEKRVRVQGYYFCHFEGSALTSVRGSASRSNIGIGYRPENFSYKREMHYNGREVIIDGILRKGPIYSYTGNSENYAYIELLTIADAPKPGLKRKRQ